MNENMAIPRTVSVPKIAAKKKPIKSLKKKETSNLKENIKLLPKKNRKCSFCGKPSEKAKRLIAGPPPLFPFICDECIEICVKILLEECPDDWRSRILSLLAIPAGKVKKPPVNKKTTVKPKPKVKLNRQKYGYFIKGLNYDRLYKECLKSL